MIGKIPLMKPYLTDEVKQKVLEVLDSGMWTEGSVTEELENQFRSYLGCKHALAVTSCTTGLELALRALKLGPGDEVIVPDYTYPATADVVDIVGANTVIIDIDPKTMNMDYDKLEAAITSRTKAILPVSLFGNPLDYEKLGRIRKHYGIPIVEDAACAIGAEHGGIKVGTFVDITVFSFHPRKFITTGEGGMVTTDNSKWADWMNSYKHFGMEKTETRLTTDFRRIGTNYKLSNLLAAVGVVQMRHVEELLVHRRAQAKIYHDLLEGNAKVTLPETTAGGIHSYQSFCVFVENRDFVLNSMRAKGIEVQIGTYALHMHQAFSENPRCKVDGEMEGSRFAFAHCLALPLFHTLTEAQQERVVRELEEVLTA